ncbi:uncharacterized protein F5147DRAFT_650035 [Suillus discolor]|uniref:Uncharacterized protein n=1 Tax=Suillus discolor TaxID=1912936 RepID=A0A9P7FEK4_9AGAM|nr:uncharacterized protein F5147DRAFT_650035 [Suillus discolor]KAG2114227.1 hypothetical protein F5147DRAFT_650035 [Suillus discolor]
MSSAHNIAATNKAFSDVVNKIDHLLGQASQLDAADPHHLTIAMEIGKVLMQVMMSHGGSVTVLLLLILSAAAELQQHINTSRTGLTGTPVWANIRGDDVHIQTHPLFPSTRNFRGSPSPLPPHQGPSKPRRRPVVEEPDECGRGTERGKCHRAASIRSHSCLSRAVVSTDDELDEEEPVTPTISTITRTCRQYVEINEEEDMDEEADEEDVVEPPRNVTAADVSLLITSGADLMEEEFTTPSAEVWAPCCRQCVMWGLICRQAYHKDHGGKLRVCTLCSRLKIRCGGKGSEVPKMKNKSVLARQALSQSRCHRSLPAAADPPVHAPVVSQVQEEQLPLEHSQTRADPALASPSNEEMQDLCDEVAGLRVTVETLQQQVINGDGQLQERLAAQEERAQLLAAELKVLRQLVVLATTQPNAEMLPTSAHPAAQHSLVATAQPTLTTDMQPLAKPSSVLPDDTSFQPGAQPDGSSTDTLPVLPTLPATPQAEVACLPVVIKADEAAN